jgi:hypothetical protein
MPASLSTVYTFFQNADAYASFLHRVEAAVVAVALNIRGEQEPSPVTPLFRARQLWALDALARPTLVARGLLPALATLANDAGLLSTQGVINATDEQILNTLPGLVVKVCNYVPELP